MKLARGQSLQFKLTGAVGLTELAAAASWSNPQDASGAGSVAVNSNGATAVDLVVAAIPKSGAYVDVDFVSIYNGDNQQNTVIVQVLGGTATPQILVKVDLAIGDTLHYSPNWGWHKTTSTGVIAFTPSTDASTADSKAVSAGLRASVADSKAVSDSLLTSTADSKGVSAGTQGSTVLSTVTSQSTVTSSAVSSAAAAASAADSKAVSGSLNTSTTLSVANSGATAASVADSKAVSDSVLISSLTSRVSSKGG